MAVMDLVAVVSDVPGVVVAVLLWLFLSLAVFVSGCFCEWLLLWLLPLLLWLLPLLLWLLPLL